MVYNKSVVKNILRLEWLFFFLVSIFFYHALHGNWLLFILLLFVPDISMVGYLKDKKLGATIYNLGHSYILGIASSLIGLHIGNDTLLWIGLIQTAHVGLDRMLGFLSTANKFVHYVNIKL